MQRSPAFDERNVPSVNPYQLTERSDGINKPILKPWTSCFMNFNCTVFNHFWVFRVLCRSLFSVPNSAHVTILFFFCTPVHSSAQGMIAGTDNKPFRASHHSTLARRTGSAVSAWLCSSIGLFTLPCLCANLFMGCRGLWKGKDMSLSSNSIEVNSRLSGVGLLSFDLPLRRVALSERHA